MTALDGLAEILELAVPDGHDMSTDDAAALREQLDQLRAQVVEDSSLPPQLKALILHRLDDIAHALDQLAVLGPDGVAAATDRLVAVITLQYEADPNPALNLRDRLDLLYGFAKRVYSSWLSLPT